MIHQFTALILSCLMLVVSATSQVGLQFCLCEKTVFMGDCPCAVTQEIDESSACSCCESCEVTESKAPRVPTPCDDCNLTLELKFDDCVPQWGADFKISNEVTLLPFQAFTNSEILCPLGNEMLLLEVRRGPPPNLLNTTTPLYLRHLVFLI